MSDITGQIYQTKIIIHNFRRIVLDFKKILFQYLIEFLKERNEMVRLLHSLDNGRSSQSDGHN